MHTDVQVPQSKPVPEKEKDLQTLHEYEAHKEALQPKANAWGARNNAARSDLSHQPSRAAYLLRGKTGSAMLHGNAAL